ncbi:MAG: membrane protein insertase YidC, partial [Planctomycetota bacterium]|nr:membrane protein insertase YidC [Planctomycetota bacterium]
AILWRAAVMIQCRRAVPRCCQGCGARQRGLTKKMDETGKTKFLFFLAIMVTAVMVMQFIEQRHVAKESRRRPPRPAALPQQPSAAATPAPVADKPPEQAEEAKRCEEIRVRRPEYEAVFSSRGGSLLRYTLLNYHLRPRPSQPAEEKVILLDEIAPQRLSLAVETLESAAAKGENSRHFIRTRDYTLREAPKDAALPAEVGEVTRGEALVFSLLVDEWEIIKTYTFPPELPFGFRLSLEIRNRATVPRRAAYTLIGPAGLLPDDDNRGGFLEGMSVIQGMSAAAPEPAAQSADPIFATCRDLEKAFAEAVQKEREKGRSEAAALEEAAPKRLHLDGRPNVVWIGLKNRFFTTLLSLGDPTCSLGSEIRSFGADRNYIAAHPRLAPFFAAHPVSGECSVRIELPLGETISPASALRHDYIFYAGPAADETLAFDPRLATAVSYTYRSFDWISRLMMKILNFFALITRNYGLAIILLTLLVKTAMHPLARKAMISAQRMQAIAPKVKDLQKKFANDQQRLHQEVMRLYREEGVSPLGGCLPVLIQFPIFVALYGAFAKGFSGRHAFFLPGWMEDLSQPDRLLSWQWNLPLIGHDLNLLPLIYLAIQIVQMRMQPTSDDPQVAQQQKIMQIMPVIFVFIFYSMPAGLVLYFTVSGLYALIEQWYLKRILTQPAKAGQK